MTRAQALSAGAKRYMGRRCYNGHDGERYTVGNDCCQCTLERNRANRGRRDRPERYVRRLTPEHSIRLASRPPEHRNGLLSAAAASAREGRVPALTDFRGDVSGVAIAPGKF